jgi:hypothetical protein
MAAPNSFAIYPAYVTSSAAIFQFDYSFGGWNSIRLNFWASGNPQVQLGFFKLGKYTFT